MEGEHGRGREAWQDDDGLAVADRQAERLAGFQRNAMRDDSGISEPRENPMADVAGALRGTSREDQHVRMRERPTHRGFEPFLLVREAAEERGFAAVFTNGCRNRRTIAVVNGGGTE